MKSEWQLWKSFSISNQPQLIWPEFLLSSRHVAHVQLVNCQQTAVTFQKCQQSAVTFQKCQQTSVTFQKCQQTAVTFQKCQQTAEITPSFGKLPPLWKNHQ